MPCATLVSTGFFMLIPLHCQVKGKKNFTAKQSIKHIKNYLMMRRHYDRISVVRYLDKLIKIEDCILLNSNLKICRNYMAEDFNGDVLVCFRDYTRHFWFRYSFDGNHCTEERYNLSDRITKLQEEILHNWDEIVAGTYVRSKK